MHGVIEALCEKLKYRKHVCNAVLQSNAAKQVSDAVEQKIYSPLFWESGADNVQSSDHCFPLHVHIDRDNKNFYNTHLSSFFSELNAIEDQYSNGLKLAFPADMCSHCKTVNQGGAMKVMNYACYLCGIHKDSCRAHSPMKQLTNYKTLQMISFLCGLI